MNRPVEFDRAVVALFVPLRNFALSLTRDRDKADDLVQDTIVQAFKYYDRYTHDTNLGGWLRTMMRNLWYTQFRRNARMVEDPDGAMAAMLEAPGEQEPTVELSHVLRAMENLTPEHRIALFYSADDTPYEQIMREQNLTLGTVKSRLNRARKNLAEMVA